MDPKNDVQDDVEESLDLPEVPEGEDDFTDYKAEALKLQNKAISQRERTKALKKELADARKAVELVTNAKKTPSSQSTGELDETQLDYLDLKGITDADDIKIIEQIVKKTGMTVRQALKDEYVAGKLEANKSQRDVKAATPSNTKRSGSQASDSLELAIAKYKQSGYKELPSDFALRSQVINKIADEQNPNKPSWR